MKRQEYNSKIKLKSFVFFNFRVAAKYSFFLKKQGGRS